ncbi:MAG: type I 3-dehydroquinate dehydratase, partial [Nitrososphaerales archaeon]
MLKRRVKICTSIGIRNIYMLNEKIEEAFNLGSDLVEIRVDYLSRIDFSLIKEAIENYMDKFELKCRPKIDGGEF